jgi:hypothetical protein
MINYGSKAGTRVQEHSTYPIYIKEPISRAKDLANETLGVEVAQ